MRMRAQGDIESVAGMSPKALTEMLEKVSGSGAFRRDYEALEAAKGEADERVAFLSARKKVTNAEKRQKKEQKEEAETHLSLQRELVRHCCTSFLVLPVLHASCCMCCSCGCMPLDTVHWTHPGKKATVWCTTRKLHVHAR